MSRRTRDEYQRSVDQDAAADVIRGGVEGQPGVNIEALREVSTTPVQATDFAINRPGHGVKRVCGSYPYGCGMPIEGPDHVCTRGRYKGVRRG